MKNDLRKFVLQDRKKLNVEEKSKIIIQKLFSTQEYISATNILCYYPLKYEIDTKPCLIDSSKKIYLPKVNGVHLDICPYKSEQLEVGSFNILEPSTNPINDLSIIDLIIIPAVAADKNGYRIGYGKGYYDRFLSGLSKDVIKIMLVYSNYVFESVFPDTYDVKVDVIITDKEIFRF